MPLDNFNPMDLHHEAWRYQHEDSHSEASSVEATLEGWKSESSHRPARRFKDGSIIYPWQEGESSSATVSSALSKLLSSPTHLPIDNFDAMEARHDAERRQQDDYNSAHCEGYHSSNDSHSSMDSVMETIDFPTGREKPVNNNQQ